MSLIATAQVPDLTGKVLLLDTKKAHRFQCFGFFVTSHHPFDTVPGPKQAEHNVIYQAILDGRLIDMTDKLDELDKLTKRARQIEVTEKEEEPLRVFFGKDDRGQMFSLVPKDLEDQKRIEAYIAETGNLPIERDKAEASSAVMERMPEKPLDETIQVALAGADELPFAPLPDKDKGPSRIILVES